MNFEEMYERIIAGKSPAEVSTLADEAMKKLDSHQQEELILLLAKRRQEELRKAKKAFAPGDRVRYTGFSYGPEEVVRGMSAFTRFWITEGPHCREFGKRLGEFVGRKHVHFTNSGTSATLLATAAICSPNVPNPLQPGDEVITLSATFPTTIASIVHNNLVPVFCDVELGTYAVDVEKLRKIKITEKTRAIMMPHPYGNPHPMDEIVQFAKEHNLRVIEDSCDALSVKYKEKNCGTFGDLSTFSFHPAHHISCGEGGAVLTDDYMLARAVHRLRAWGSDCWCASDEVHPHGACNARFNFKINGVPYNHRYVYTDIGYNLKLSEPQAAMGLAQLSKIHTFKDKRNRNYQIMFNRLKNYQDDLILPVATPGGDPSWFAFPITIKPGSKLDRHQLSTWLEEKNIETRPFFAGNVIEQPGFINIKHRLGSDLKNSEYIMRNTLIVGVSPILEPEVVSYVAEEVARYVESKR